jgi:hypothetical protein
MPDAAYPPPRPLSVGEILDLGFRLYKASLISCMLFAGLGVVANWLPNVYTLVTRFSAKGAPAQLGQASIFFLITIAAVLLGLAFSASVVLRQYAIARGDRVGGELRVAVKRLPAMVLQVLAYGGLFVAGAIIVLPVLFLTGTGLAGRVIVASLALVLFSYLLVSISCAFTAMLVVPTGAIDAIGRSWRLTRGNFWRIAAILTVGLFVMLVAYGLVSTVAALAIGLFGRGDIAVVSATLGLLMVVVGALVTPLYTAIGLAIFGDLTVRKQGTDLEQRIAAT